MEADITQLLIDVREGEAGAVDGLYGAVYDELRQLAHFQLRRKQPGATLNTTALVHEAYLKLFDQSRVSVQDRSHFFALSARAMRQILVDYFRRGQAQKRGGGRTLWSLPESQMPIEARGDVLLALDEALTRLTALNERLGRVVEYKFFGGMTEAEIATLLDLTPRTVRSDWRKARLWLTRELSEEEETERER
jgi:RNA polymerase sigma factor (TIGR02999 family)